MSYIISYVGAGGKTSSIYQDAAAFVNEGKKVMITTTTHMYVPKDRVFIDGREKSCEKLREEVAGILKKNGICVCGTILSDNKKTEKRQDVFIYLNQHNQCSRYDEHQSCKGFNRQFFLKYEI